MTGNDVVRFIEEFRSRLPLAKDRLVVFSINSDGKAELNFFLDNGKVLPVTFDESDMSKDSDLIVREVTELVLAKYHGAEDV